MSITKKDVDNVINSFNDFMKCVDANCKATDEEVIRLHELKEELKNKCAKHSDFTKRLKCMKQHPEIAKHNKTKKACLKKHCDDKNKKTLVLEKKLDSVLFKSFADVTKCANKECKSLTTKLQEINDECHKKHKKDFVKAIDCKDKNSTYKKVEKELIQCQKTKCKSEVKHKDEISKLLGKYNKVVFATIKKYNKAHQKVIAKHTKKKQKNSKIYKK